MPIKFRSLAKKRTEAIEDEKIELKEQEHPGEQEEEIAFEPKQEKPKDKPSLVKVIAKEFAGGLVLTAVYHIFYDILQFVQPQLLK